jgi:uncharacterized protein
VSNEQPIKRQRFWPNGQVKEEWFEVDGRKEGWRRFYLEAGLMFAEMEFRNGVGNGLIREWRTNGQLRLQSTLKNGEYHGHFSVWWPNGNLMEDGEFDHGKHVKGYSYYTEDGRLWKVVKGTEDEPQSYSAADVS